MNLTRIFTVCLAGLFFFSAVVPSHVLADSPLTTVLFATDDGDNETRERSGSRSVATDRTVSATSDDPGKASTTKTTHHPLTGTVPGRLVLGVGVAAANNVLNEGSVKGGVKTTARQVATPEYLLGVIPGGIIGGLIGSTIPLAGMLGATGVMATFLSTVPALGLATIMARLGSETVSQIREGNCSISSVFGAIDWVALLSQIMAACVGCTIGSLFGPAPLIASMVLGVLCSWAVGKLLETVRSKAYDSREESIEYSEKSDSSVGADAEVDSTCYTINTEDSSSVSSLKADVDKAYRTFLTTGTKEDLDSYTTLKTSLQERIAVANQ